MIRTVNHTGLTVASVDRSLEFYRDMLGLTVDESRSGEWDGPFLTHLTGYDKARVRIAMVQCGDGSRIQLEEFVHPRLAAAEQEWGQPGSGHLCIEVDDIFAVRDVVRRAGYVIVSEPPDPVPLPPESIHAGGYFLAVLDPDGHVVECLQPPTNA